jgi:hypothetical protein
VTPSSEGARRGIIVVSEHRPAVRFTLTHGSTLSPPGEIRRATLARMDDQQDERLAAQEAEDAKRALLKVDPDAPPAKPNEDEPTPQPPLKDQGDPLGSQRGAS